ncbi:hypothetical protein [Xenorhabdus bovienii]|uniref:hypothetical protein n=1 Tax=Xenorhabdus bovienii TaxID=40576 RepID=UPI003DA62440
MNKFKKQDLIELTPEQLKAWKRIERAVIDFKKSGGVFYTVLDCLHGLNGKNVYAISVGDGGDIITENILMSSIRDAGFSGMCDDIHSIYLIDKAKTILAEEK